MNAFALLKQAFLAWKQDHASYLAAAISYHTIFSLAPLFLIILAITGVIYGQEASQRQFQELLQQYIGLDSANAVQQLLEQANISARSGTAFVVGLVLTLVGSIGVFKQLQEAVTIIWDCPPKKRGWKHTILRYALLFALVLLSSALLIASLVASAIVSQGSERISQFIGIEFPWLLSIVNTIVSLGLSTVLFALLFRVLPDTRVEWRKIWPAALVTALLFNIGKFAIGIYLGRSTIGSVYGAAGSLVALLVWIFYAAQIFLYGVELVKVQHRPSSPSHV